MLSHTGDTRSYRLRGDSLARCRDVLMAALAPNDEIVEGRRGLEHAEIIGEEKANVPEIREFI